MTAVTLADGGGAIGAAGSGANGGAPPSAAAALFAWFDGGARANRFWPGFTDPDADGKVWPIKNDKWCGPPTVEMCEAHLRGEMGLGIIPRRGDGKVLVGIIDADAYHTISIPEIVEAIQRLKLPLLVTRSKSGGGAHTPVRACAGRPAGHEARAAQYRGAARHQAEEEQGGKG